MLLTTKFARRHRGLTAYFGAINPGAMRDNLPLIGRIGNKLGTQGIDVGDGLRLNTATGAFNRPFQSSAGMTNSVPMTRSVNPRWTYDPRFPNARVRDINFVPDERLFPY